MNILEKRGSQLSDKHHKQPSQTLVGVWYAVAAFTLWGLLPLYWKALKQVPAEEILAHRIFWSFIFVITILLVRGRIAQLKNLLSRKSDLLKLFVSSLLISGNWFTYIWAVNHDHVVESSLGYYINPLFSVFLGMVVLKERLNSWQYLSLILAAVGVIVITLQYGRIPWIALILAFSFGLYGLAKKMVKVDAMTGLALETAFVTPIAFLYLLFKQIGGQGAFGTISLLSTLLLIGAGIVTATPLLWFAQGAKRLPLSMVGFIQFLAPTMMLLLGVFLYQETFTKIHLISFGLIWTALIIYSVANTDFIKKIHLKDYNKSNNFSR